MSVPMRDGSKVGDRRLGRLKQFDERSRNFKIRSLITAVEPRSYTWVCDYTLNQGSEGSCTGFSIAHEINARPKIHMVGYTRARRIYLRAKQLDPWPGEAYEGSSVLAAVKAAVELGYYGEYRWAFGIDDLILAVGYKGPAILGIAWFSAMNRPNEKGFIEPLGTRIGGHAILCNAVDVKRKRFFLTNSWGEWGIPRYSGDRANGAWISFDHMDWLLKDDGEACIPVVRRSVF